MSYSDRSDLNLDEQRLIELTDSAAARGVTDESLIARLGIQADGIIDSFIGLKYVMPPPVGVSVPPLVKWWSTTIWRKLLYAHRETIDTPKSVMDDYERTMKQLELAAGIRPVSDGQELILNLPRLQSSTDPSPKAGALDPTRKRAFGRGNDPIGS